MLPALSFFMGPPTSINGGRFSIGVDFSVPVVGVPFSTNSGCPYKHNYTDTFSTYFFAKLLWYFYIVTVCHIPTSYFLVDSISKILISYIRLITCISREFHWPLTQRFSVQCNHTVCWNMFATNIFLTLPISHLATASSTINICPYFYIGDTIVL